MQGYKGKILSPQKDQVVPFEPDTSDLQPDPIDKTHLCVFEPVVVQDIPAVDLFPASCHLEQTTLEDLDDPQPGPSGLHSTAPEEPADHQPEQQTAKDKKTKGSRAGFKRACKAIKGTFSRHKKTKVVPFKPDTSDLQPDPIVQTHLCVFEPVVVQDIPAVDLFPASCHLEQTTLEDLDDPQPGPSGLQSTAPEEHVDHQPEQQMAKDRKTKGSRAGFKRACKAIKGTFSRHKKTKVVPFEPDPSDLQPDPIVQTHLCVFEPVVVQDPAVDLFPASCDLEKTTLEDLDDPQPGPSGLHSAAPEEPVDHQPEQQTAKDRKTKGSRAGFKRACKAIKGTFSRHKKTKVVPFKPDTSDLQPDPIVQTHLCVFEPVVVQDPAVDLFPASCHFEQTTLEDLDDPQPGPSGLHSAAPEEPVDHQPEQQTAKDKKTKGSRAGFKRACKAIKGTFSRSKKTKVVHFEPDPSDLQPDPSVQTHLCVFEPVLLQDPAVDLFPASCHFEQTTHEDLDDPLPGPSGLQSTAPEEPADHQPEQQTAKDRKTKGSRAGFKRACKAIKGTFSRHKKTKVVPFEPDPSDLQPDPIVQTHLCVFEPVVVQDPAVDLFPASCDLEKTTLEDLDDPQPGPSGLHSAAPEEPVDHQPEQQTAKDGKTKGSRAGFKRACKAIKGTFSRHKKTKVVPFEPDPSDLQPDPIFRTHLCVFEPVLLQDPAVDLFPASCNFEQTTLEDLDDPQPGPSGLQSTAPEEPADHQPEQQTAKDKKTKGSRAGFKRACKAIKGKFSRHKKTKVVPFEPDPSDLQPDPIVQTHLCVFEPVVVQDIPAVDLFPASCHLEQTTLEDLDDPQPGPSGLQSTAPEEPTDHQPEQQTAKDRKTKGSRAGFKRACKAIKGKFSRHKKTQVVPFEPDPSDLQQDPIVQTHLCVFEPVVVQDIPAVDLFPASCHFEQTTHEDLDDPQPGPSGIQSAAPEEPVDHQPEQQTKEPTDPDPSDLQADPPVLEPTVLEEPAEIQPERSVSSLYEEGRILGIGYSGVVYEGIRKSDGQKVAIKKLIGTNDFRLNVPGYSKPLFMEAAINLQLHKREKCPNIVQMLDWFEEEERCTIVLEYPHPCLTLWHFLWLVIS
ncbi:cell surface glycoprotein 1-like [Triplophysa dalaica]|uniref:cell surface glycoprotein 1-like n=1 Tax=Triplophysa dalaica TaxID=1582913 RepID=UPI0024DF62E3|nr:cell surface glycoprotein 1-like [Triplophysa dalaica]